MAVAEHLVEDEHHAFVRAECLQDQQHRDGHGLGEDGVLAHVRCGLDRFGKPSADVVFATAPARCVVRSEPAA